MKKNQKVVVVVPIYKDMLSDNESYSFYHNAKILENRDIYLVGPRRLGNYLYSLSKTITNGHVILVDDKYFNNKLRGANRLFMTYDFYNKFNKFEYMLVCHFDAIIFEDRLDYWVSLKLDYIGAPLFYGNSVNFDKLRKGSNGGFCLRNIQSCLAVLSQPGRIFSNLRTLWNMENRIDWKIFRVVRDGIIFNFKWGPLRPIINEDMFWSCIVPEKHSWYKVANFDTARLFAFEINPRLLHKLNKGVLPMGIHGWWKHDKEYCIGLMKQFDPTMLDTSKEKISKLV